MTEEWRQIPGFEGFYEASSLGRVRSLDRITRASNRCLRRRGKVLKANPDTHWYFQFRMWRDGLKVQMLVHKAVLLAFVGEPENGQEGCHNNGVKNDNRAANLRWDSRAGNVIDKMAHGGQPSGSEVWSAKLTAEDVQLIKDSKGSISCSALAEKFGISRGYISHIWRGKKWAHVGQCERRFE